MNEDNILSITPEDLNAFAQENQLSSSEEKEFKLNFYKQGKEAIDTAFKDAPDKRVAAYQQFESAVNSSLNDTRTKAIHEYALAANGGDREAANEAIATGYNWHKSYDSKKANEPKFITSESGLAVENNYGIDRTDEQASTVFDLLRSKDFQLNEKTSLKPSYLNDSKGNPIAEITTRAEGDNRTAFYKFFDNKDSGIKQLDTQEFKYALPTDSEVASYVADLNQKVKEGYPAGGYGTTPYAQSIAKAFDSNPSKSAQKVRDLMKEAQYLNTASPEAAKEFIATKKRNEAILSSDYVRQNVTDINAFEDVFKGVMQFEASAANALTNGGEQDNLAALERDTSMGSIDTGLRDTPVDNFLKQVGPGAQSLGNMLIPLVSGGAGAIASSGAISSSVPVLGEMAVSSYGMQLHAIDSNIAQVESAIAEKARVNPLDPELNLLQKDLNNLKTNRIVNAIGHAIVETGTESLGGVGGVFLKPIGKTKIGKAVTTLFEEYFEEMAAEPLNYAVDQATLGDRLTPEMQDPLSIFYATSVATAPLALLGIGSHSHNQDNAINKKVLFQGDKKLPYDPNLPYNPSIPNPTAEQVKVAAQESTAMSETLAQFDASKEEDDKEVSAAIDDIKSAPQESAAPIKAEGPTSIQEELDAINKQLNAIAGEQLAGTRISSKFDPEIIKLEYKKKELESALLDKARNDKNTKYWNGTEYLDYNPIRQTIIPNSSQPISKPSVKQAEKPKEFQSTETPEIAVDNEQLEHAHSVFESSTDFNDFSNKMQSKFGSSIVDSLKSIWDWILNSFKSAYGVISDSITYATQNLQGNTISFNEAGEARKFASATNYKTATVEKLEEVKRKYPSLYNTALQSLLAQVDAHGVTSISPADLARLYSFREKGFTSGVSIVDEGNALAKLEGRDKADGAFTNPDGTPNDKAPILTADEQRILRVLYHTNVINEDQLGSATRGIFGKRKFLSLYARAKGKNVTQLNNSADSTTTPVEKRQSKVREAYSTNSVINPATDSSEHANYIEASYVHGTNDANDVLTHLGITPIKGGVEGANEDYFYLKKQDLKKLYAFYDSKFGKNNWVVKDSSGAAGAGFHSADSLKKDLRSSNYNGINYEGVVQKKLDIHSEYRVNVYLDSKGKARAVPFAMSKKELYADGRTSHHFPYRITTKTVEYIQKFAEAALEKSSSSKQDKSTGKGAIYGVDVAILNNEDGTDPFGAGTKMDMKVIEFNSADPYHDANNIGGVTGTFSRHGGFPMANLQAFLRGKTPADVALTNVMLSMLKSGAVTVDGQSLVPAAVTKKNEAIKKAKKTRLDVLGSRSDEPIIYGKEGGTAEDALNRVPKDHKLRPLVDFILSKNFIQLKRDRVTDQESKDGRAFRGFSEKLGLTKKGVTPDVLLHEVIHTLTADILNKYLKYHTEAGFKKAAVAAINSDKTPNEVKRILNLYFKAIDQTSNPNFYYGGISIKSVKGRKITIPSRDIGNNIFSAYAGNSDEEHNEFVSSLKSAGFDVSERKTRPDGSKSDTFYVSPVSDEAKEMMKPDEESPGYFSIPIELNSYNRKIKNKRLIGDADLVVKKGGYYGFGDVYEFMAEAFSDSNFQKVLNSMKGDGGVSLWSKFVDAIRSILGISKKDNVSSMLDDVLNATMDVADLHNTERKNNVGRYFTSSGESLMSSSSQSNDFRALQDEQRKTPESMFDPKSNPGSSNSQILQFAMEHTGDLIHRVSYADGVQGWGGATGVDYGMDAGRIKADRVLYGKRDLLLGGVEQQARSNWKYAKSNGKTTLSESEWMDQMKQAGKNYADAYRKLNPITKAQKAAKEAAIALGEGNYEKWAEKVEEVKARVSTREGYLEPIRNSQLNENPVTNTANPNIFYSGIDPTRLIQDIKTIFRGAKDFASWSKDMIQKYGALVKNHLTEIWDKLTVSKGSITENDLKDMGVINTIIPDKEHQSKRLTDIKRVAEANPIKQAYRYRIDERFLSPASVGILKDIRADKLQAGDAVTAIEKIKAEERTNKFAKMKRMTPNAFRDFVLDPYSEESMDAATGVLLDYLDSVGSDPTSAQAPRKMTKARKEAEIQLNENIGLFQGGYINHPDFLALPLNLREIIIAGVNEISKMNDGTSTNNIKRAAASLGSLLDNGNPVGFMKYANEFFSNTWISRAVQLDRLTSGNVNAQVRGLIGNPISNYRRGHLNNEIGSFIQLGVEIDKMSRGDHNTFLFLSDLFSTFSGNLDAQQAERDMERGDFTRFVEAHYPKRAFHTALNDETNSMPAVSRARAGIAATLIQYKVGAADPLVDLRRHFNLMNLGINYRAEIKDQKDLAAIDRASFNYLVAGLDYDTMDYTTIINTILNRLSPQERNVLDYLITRSAAFLPAMRTVSSISANRQLEEWENYTHQKVLSEMPDYKSKPVSGAEAFTSMEPPIQIRKGLGTEEGSTGDSRAKAYYETDILALGDDFFQMATYEKHTGVQRQMLKALLANPQFTDMVENAGEESVKPKTERIKELMGNIHAVRSNSNFVKLTALSSALWELIGISKGYQILSNGMLFGNLMSAATTLLGLFSLEGNASSIFFPLATERLFNRTVARGLRNVMENNFPSQMHRLVAYDEAQAAHTTKNRSFKKMEDRVAAGRSRLGAVFSHGLGTTYNVPVRVMKGIGKTIGYAFGAFFEGQAATNMWWSIYIDRVNQTQGTDFVNGEDYLTNPIIDNDAATYATLQVDKMTGNTSTREHQGSTYHLDNLTKRGVTNTIMPFLRQQTQLNQQAVNNIQHAATASTNRERARHLFRAGVLIASNAGYTAVKYLITWFLLDGLASTDFIQSLITGGDDEEAKKIARLELERQHEIKKRKRDFSAAYDLLATAVANPYFNSSVAKTIVEYGHDILKTKPEDEERSIAIKNMQNDIRNEKSMMVISRKINDFEAQSRSLDRIRSLEASIDSKKNLQGLSVAPKGKYAALSANLGPISAITDQSYGLLEMLESQSEKEAAIAQRAEEINKTPYLMEVVDKVLKTGVTRFTKNVSTDMAQRQLGAEEKRENDLKEAANKINRRLGL